MQRGMRQGQKWPPKKIHAHCFTCRFLGHETKAEPMEAPASQVAVTAGDAIPEQGSGFAEMPPHAYSQEACLGGTQGGWLRLDDREATIGSNAI